MMNYLDGNKNEFNQISTVLPETFCASFESFLYFHGTRYYWTTNMDELKEEIQCRIDYFKQLCRDRQFVDQEMWHYYRGSASALNALLSYMERGINWDSLKDSDKKNSVEDSDLAKKILKGKESKSRFISEAIRKKF